MDNLIPMLIPIGAALVGAFLTVAGMWKVFAKAGQPGWAVIVPIYNFICLLHIIQKPVWMIILIFIPFLNILMLIYMYWHLCKVFDRGIGTFLLMVILKPVGWMVLGFGSAEYQAG